MKNMKKIMRILCCLLAVCMVAGAFVGCGGSNKSETKEETNPAPGTVDNPTETPVDPTEPADPTDPVIEFDPAIDADPDPITLNIGTYNIANGSKVDHQMIKLAKDIVDQKLDIVGLEEVDQFCTRSGNMDTMKTMSELTGMPYYAHINTPDGKEIQLGSLKTSDAAEGSEVKMLLYCDKALLPGIKTLYVSSEQPWDVADNT